MAVKIVKPEHHATLDAAIDAAIVVMRQDPHMAEFRQRAIDAAKRDFPGAPDDYLQKVQDLAIVHTIVGRIIERAGEISDNLAGLVLESIAKVSSTAMIQLMFSSQNEPPVKPAEAKKVAAPADIPDILPRDLAKMKES